MSKHEESKEITASEYLTLLEGLLILKYEFIYSKYADDLFPVSLIMERLLRYPNLSSHFFQFLLLNVGLNFNVNQQPLNLKYFHLNMNNLIFPILFSNSMPANREDFILALLSRIDNIISKRIFIK